MEKGKGVPNSEATRFKTGEKQVEVARKGGIASGIAKKEKKLFKEAIEKKIGQSMDQMIDSMIKQSIKGNVKAITFLRDTIGEKPVDKFEGNVSVDKIEDLIE